MVQTCIDLIAEIAGGHEGDFNNAQSLIDAAHEQGATSVKFQVYVADDLCASSHTDYKIFKRLQFSDQEWKELRARARHLGLNFYTDVFGAESLRIAKLLKVDGFKIHPSDLGNIGLIEEISNFSDKIFLGVGGRKRIEVYEAVSFLRQVGYTGKIILVTGYQLFPTPEDEHSIDEIRHFKYAYKDFNVDVCVADHIDGSLGSSVLFPLVAIGAGASFVEKHLTLDRTQRSEDFEAALNPSDFGQLSKNIKSIECIDAPYPEWSGQRQLYRSKTTKRPIAKCSIAAGELLSLEKLSFLRNSSVCDPLPFNVFNSKIVTQNISANQELTQKNFKPKVSILITSRFKSTRLPGKALIEFRGIPALEVLIRNLKKVSSVDDIILCTTTSDEDDKLVELADKNGIKSFRGHASNIAQRLHDACVEHEVDHFVRVTADDLLRDVGLIELAVDSHLDKHADYTYFKQCMTGLDSEVISYRAIKLILDRAEDPSGSEYLTWYLDDESLFNVNPLSVTSEYEGPYTFSLDDMDDLSLFNKIFEHFNPIEQIEIEDLKSFLASAGIFKYPQGERTMKVARRSINTFIKA
jgi:sialic acid synthase SpsE/spore coat polysaccharide biosynthesis protein SpsF (cytidylyltransferase family)